MGLINSALHHFMSVVLFIKHQYVTTSQPKHHRTRAVLQQPCTKTGIENRTYERCKHTERFCFVFCDLCQRFFPCPKCHDEDIGAYDDDEKHELINHEITKIRCSVCDRVQPPQQSCERCHILFAAYYCAICHFWDNTCTMYSHCQKCNCCLKVFDGMKHCETCDVCIPSNFFISSSLHSCIPHRMMQNCSICQQPLHGSQDVSLFMCGHDIHTSCLSSAIKNGCFRCPICRKTILNARAKQVLWSRTRDRCAQNPMPIERLIKVWCNDCNIESQSLWHVYGNECQKCGGFNTA
jgi:RING finger/CHY zinc finger protein 1